MLSDSSNPIILYDGTCGFCDRTVQFILKRDSRDQFRFAALQSEFAPPVLKRHGVSTEVLESICLVLDYGLPTERIQMRSTAVISILRRLGTFWRASAVLFSIVPLPLRDWGYNLVAKYRYSIFGKFDTCPLPKASDRHKFLDLAEPNFRHFPRS
jgi:predicted DCC family thiol-disulfide oxidoreductase YuxK